MYYTGELPHDGIRAEMYADPVAPGEVPLRVIMGRHGPARAPRREALLLLGGDKGKGKGFYRTAIARAERLWVEHLARLEEEEER